MIFARANADGPDSLRTETAPPAGTVVFADHQLPPLQDGRYRITVQQSIGVGVPTVPQNHYRRTHDFVVDGPRLALGPTDIQSVYPPDFSQGAFTHTLPHIVLTQPTLPWQRTLVAGERDHPAQRQTPWVALLVLNKDEVVGAGNSPTGAQIRPLPEIIRPGEGVLGPDLALSAWEEKEYAKGTYSTVDISRQTFCAVMPRLRELPDLAHRRQVNTADKDLHGLTDGAFAVVVGNRFPRPDDITMVHLVSLEGFHSYLDSPEQALPQTPTVRLISLASWAFTAIPETANHFAERMAALDVDLLRLPVPDGLRAELDAPATPAARLVKEALDTGYTAARYFTRAGDETLTWYRGPFTPVVTTPVSQPPTPFAEAALVYDSRAGMFDSSQAVAWHTGRLLGLSDRSFCTIALRWRRQGTKQARLLQERQRLFQRYPLQASASASWTALARYDLMQNAAGDAVLGFLADLAGPGAGQMSGLGQPLDPTRLVRQAEKLPGLLSAQAFEAVLRAGDDPSYGLLAQLFPPASTGQNGGD